MSMPVMKIPWDAKATFVSRPNRFLGIVDITSPKKDKKKNLQVHVHDPGRLKELLYPGNKVLLRKAKNMNRKTKWDVIAAFYEGHWILAHSGYHRAIAEWILNNSRVSPFGMVKSITPEARIGKSRLDFLLEKKNRKRIWVEVKGCTLAIDGVALFPDAPTERGRRHLETLIKLMRKGDGAAIIILIFRSDAKCFAPNEETDPKFNDTFYEAIDSGVLVHPMVFKFENKKIYYKSKIPLCPKTNAEYDL
jgi:sugar fermentation stimulation protein A